MPDLRIAVETTIKSYLDAVADREFCIHDFYRLLANILHSVETAVKGVAGDDVGFNALVVDTEWAVDTYFVKYDLPGIGATLESFIDRQAVSLVRPGMELLRPAPHENH